MSADENIVLIDWLTFTTTKLELDRLISFLGLERVNFVDCKGRYGYKQAKQFGGIWIMYDGFKKDMGICVEMSAQGCRQYETSGLYDLDYLCSFLAQNSDKYHITRLDVAFDDIDCEGNGLLDMSVIVEYFRRNLFFSRFRSKSVQCSGKHTTSGDDVTLALSCYFGSVQSNTRFRIYDKSLERGGLDYHWTRFEIQLRDKMPLVFLLDNHKLGDKFYGLINSNLRFIEPNDTDTNRRRWASPEWWTAFLQSVLKISVFTEKGV